MQQHFSWELLIKKIRQDGVAEFIRAPLYSSTASRLP